MPDLSKIDFMEIAFAIVMVLVVLGALFPGCSGDQPTIRCANGAEITRPTSATPPPDELRELCAAAGEGK